MKKPNLLIIGAGGVGAVAAYKAVQFGSEFGTITLASRSAGKLDAIAADVAKRQPGREPLKTCVVDAQQQVAVEDCIRELDAAIVLNVASPYCNTAIMDACIECGAHYMDTALAEVEHQEFVPAPWYENAELPRRSAFAANKLNAVLGIGFDPGAVNVFCAEAKKHHLDSIESIDIIDVNGGSHGRYFATNFAPDTNLREVREDVVYWEDGGFRTIPHHSRKMTVDLPVVGSHDVYSMGHDEIHSLSRVFPETKRIEFWMGFGAHYLKVLEVLNELGFLSSTPVEVEGVNVKPLQLVKALLPDPASLAEGYTGEVCIGCDITGIKDGQRRRIFIYSTCDHVACYEEVGSQAISYTTGVPAIAAAVLLARGDWNPETMVNAEELDPDPFLELMPEVGIGWQVIDLPLDGSWPSDRA